MVRTDATVTAPMADEAFSFVEDSDSDEAIRWLGMTEPAVASKIQAASRKALNRLGDKHGSPLTTDQIAAVRRAICNTAVATATAMLDGRHNMWNDLVHGPLAATLDPWVGTRRQVLMFELTLPESAKPKKGRRKRVTKRDGTEVIASKLGITGCVPAEDPTVSPTRPVLLVTSTGLDRQPRYEVVSKDDGEKLLRALVHGLAALGSEAATAAWPAVCSGDPSLEPPQPRRPSRDRDDDDDGEANVPA